MSVVVLGCGRVGFDPTTTSDGSPTDGRSSDANADGGLDDALMDALPDAVPDVMPTACETATLIGFGRTPAFDTCAQGDRVDGCAGPGTRDLVFEFIAPANRGYSFSARNPGTDTISNSIGRLDAACSGTTGNCAGLLSFPMTAGQRVYLVVEAANNGCAMIEVVVE